MPIERKHNSYVALIGAYERDNFGDTLFLKVCGKLLEPWPIAPLSLISRNMNEVGGGAVISASAWFDSCKDSFLPKAVIVVGGEVLTCPVIDALSCDIDPLRSDSLHKTDESNKRRIEEIVSWHAGDLAYVPDLVNILRNAKRMVPLALNSVGGSSLEPGSHKLSALLRILEQADHLSVRDSVTQQLINNGKAEQQSADLNPDIVSTLKRCCTPEVENAFSKAAADNPWIENPYLLFQANDEYIKKNDPLIIGAKIAETADALNLAVVFQPAGIATGHDSFEMLDELALITKAQSRGNLDVQTQRSRDVWTQVAVIANAACFVGTSLHGRIVAAAYGRPRVSLMNEKVKNYASTWEEEDFQPFDVPVEKMKASVEMAMNTSPKRLLDHADRQAQLALDGFTRLKKRLNLFDPPENLNATNEKIRILSDLARFRECEILREAVFDLGYELSKKQESIRSLERQLSSSNHKLLGILQSPSWRLTKPIRALRRLASKV